MSTGSYCRTSLHHSYPYSTFAELHSLLGAVGAGGAGGGAGAGGAGVEGAGAGGAGGRGGGGGANNLVLPPAAAGPVTPCTGPAVASTGHRR